MDKIKQICAQIIELWDDECYDINTEINELRAALTENEPEVPTDEELLEINDGAYFPGTDEVNDEDDSSWQYTSDYIRWLDENGTPEEQAAYTAKGLRAVFEAGRRWGRPAPNPVPVTKRLPEPKDCDAEGRCWWLIEPYPRPIGPSGKLWSLCRYCPGTNYWLAANALPQPS